MSEPPIDDFPADEHQDEPANGIDARDEQVAALLAVEPLDEMTRRRMVNHALRESQAPLLPSRRALAIAGAAVLVAAVVLGITAQGDGKQQPTAARAPSGESAARGASPASEALAAGAHDLGDYGNLAESANASRLQRDAAAAGRGTSSLDAKASSAAPRADLAAEVDAALACAPPTQRVVAVATGTLGGRFAVVLVTAGGSQVVLTDRCEVRNLG